MFFKDLIQLSMCHFIWTINPYILYLFKVILVAAVRACSRTEQTDFKKSSSWFLQDAVRSVEYPSSKGLGLS